MALLDEISEFLEATGMSPTAFGRNAVNDGHLVRRLRQDANITLRTVDRIRRFMREYSSMPANSEGQADVA